jgi:hypothetical protein
MEAPPERPKQQKKSKGAPPSMVQTQSAAQQLGGADPPSYAEWILALPAKLTQGGGSPTQGSHVKTLVSLGTILTSLCLMRHFNMYLGGGNDSRLFMPIGSASLHAIREEATIY